VFGLFGGLRNWRENRTQAREVASLIAAGAQPGDVVLYCPDQVGPSVHRLLARSGTASKVREMTFPDLARPEFVNWINYRERNQSADSAAVAKRVVDRAQGATIWYVVSPGYHSVEDKCEGLEAALGGARGGGRALASISPHNFEVMGLVEYPRS
jgi:hypothetical protein